MSELQRDDLTFADVSKARDYEKECKKCIRNRGITDVLSARGNPKRNCKICDRAKVEAEKEAKLKASRPEVKSRRIRDIKPKSDKTTKLQSIVFLAKEGWNQELASKWLKRHKRHPIKPVDNVFKQGRLTQLRYRIVEPTFKSYFTKKNNNGILLVFGSN